MRLLSIAASLVSLGLVSALDITSSSNVAVYWGQNSQGSQDRLSTYCTDSVDIVILSFLNNYPDNFNLNFANQCGTTFPDGVLHCPTIGEDIKTCQAAGKTVLLSLGGSVGDYSFTSDAQAQEFASTLWNKFGSGSDDERPFDDAVVDGFDFDIENNNQVGYVALANELRQLFSQDSSKSYFLSASPQCPYPDQSVGDLLSQADLDFAFIQFYNNYCSLDQTFNWNTWSEFAQTAPNSDIKLFVGLPGASVSGAGYVDADVVQETINEIKCDSALGGVSLWDASSSFTNFDSNGVAFVDQIKNVLEEETCVVSSSAVASSTVASSSAATSIASSSAATSIASSSAATSIASSSDTSIASSSVVDASSIRTGYQNTSITSVGDYTATATDIKTTLITITSCDDHKCTEIPVETGLTTVTEGTTSYTTYCPLSGTETVTDVSTTVITVTSCADNKCTEVPVTTGVTVVTDVDTVYTTYCPLTSEAKKYPVAVSTGVVPTTVESSVVPTTIAQVSVSSQSASNQTTIASVETYIGAANSATGSWILALAAIVACLV